MSNPTITLGAVYTPPMFSYLGYTATEQRDYPDGARIVIMHSDRRGCRGVAWNRGKGTTFGSVTRDIKSPSDIGALLRSWRKWWKTVNAS